MENSSHPKSDWNQVKGHLLKAIPQSSQEEDDNLLSFEVQDEDWLVEFNAEGVLSCQSGYALDDMKSILSDGTPEDLGTDELAKQAKFYLQQTVSKYRNRLKQDGFSERTEMNDDFVAIYFERTLDLSNLPELSKTIQSYQRLFS
jgi:hypothetical protein